MRTFKLLMTGLLCVGFIACSSDKEINGTGPNEEANGTGYMKIVLTDKNRTRTETPSETGKDYENAIREILVAMSYSADGTPNSIIDKRLVISNLSPTGDGTIVTSPFPVDPGTYHVWVVANPTDTQKAIGTGHNPASAVVSGINASRHVIESTSSTDYIAATGADKGSFIMFNECDSKTEAENGIYATVVVTEANTRDNPAKNSKPIVLERLAAKIESNVARSMKMDQLFYEQYYDKKNVGETEKSAIKVAYDGCVFMNGAMSLPLQQKWGDSKLEHDYLLAPTEPSGHYYQMNVYRTQADSNPEVYGELTPTFDRYLTTQHENDEPAVIYCMENKDDKNPSSLIHKFTLTQEGKNIAKDGPHFYYLCQTATFYNSYESVIAAVRQYYLTMGNTLPGNITPTEEMMNDFEDELRNLEKGNLSEFHDRWDVKTYWNGEMYYIYEIENKNPKYSYQGEALDKDGLPVPVTLYDKAIYRNTIYRLTATTLGRLGSYLPEKSQSERQWMEVEVEVKDWVVSLNDDIILN